MKVEIKPLLSAARKASSRLKETSGRLLEPLAVRILPADRYVGYDAQFVTYKDSVQLHRGINPATGRRYNVPTLRVLRGNNRLTREVTDLVGLTGFMRRLPKSDVSGLASATNAALASGEEVGRRLDTAVLGQLGEAGLDAAYLEGGLPAVQATVLEHIGQAGLSKAYIDGGWAGVKTAIKTRFGRP